MKRKYIPSSNKSQDKMSNIYIRYRNRFLPGYIINKKAEGNKGKGKNSFMFDYTIFDNHLTFDFNYFEKKNEVNDFFSEAISPIKSVNSTSKILRENDVNKSIYNISIYKPAGDSNDVEKEDSYSLTSINHNDLLSQKICKNNSEKGPKKNFNRINYTSISLNFYNDTYNSSKSRKYKRLLGCLKNTNNLHSNNNSSKDKEEFTIDRIINQTF